MSDRIQQSVGALEEIKKGLREKEEQKGAYYCSFPSFIDIYHVIDRMMERSGISVYIMLCTLTDKNGEIRMGTDRNKEASEALRVAICNSLRRGDFYTRYNESQFLVMLSGTTLENCQVLSARIDRNFRKEFNGHFRINYYMASVAELREEKDGETLSFHSAGRLLEDQSEITGETHLYGRNSIQSGCTGSPLYLCGRQTAWREQRKGVLLLFQGSNVFCP